MRDKSLEFKVGLTVFIAFLVCVVGLMWLEGFKIGKETYLIHANFSMVGGIKRGDAVNVNGVERGEVQKVELSNRGVDVSLRIDAGTVIPEDSKVVLQAEGLLGERVVSIIKGKAQTPVTEGARLKGVYEPGISETFASLGDLLEDLEDLTASMGKVAEMLTEEGNFRRSLHNLAEVTANLKDLISDTAPDFRKSAAALKNSSVRFDTLLERNSDRIERIVAGLDTTATGMPSVVSRVDSLAGLLIDISNRLKSEQTTAGALLSNREFIDGLQKTVDSLDRLVTDIKENPKKYFKVEIF